MFQVTQINRRSGRVVRIVVLESIESLLQYVDLMIPAWESFRLGSYAEVGR